jgi:hypothetical protein
LDLYSITGQFIQSQSVTQIVTESAFDVSNLATGVYVVRFITTDGSKATQKVVVTR